MTSLNWTIQHIRLMVVLLDDLNEQYGIEFEDSEDIDTIGGWLQSRNTNLQKMIMLILSMIVGYY